MSAIQVTEDGYYFAAYSSVTSDTLEEEVSDGRTKSFTKASHGYILDLGYAKAGEVIRIKNSNNERVDITAYKLNMGALDTAYETLNSQTMELTSFSDRKITGTIDVEKAGDLVFSIAREDGWTVYVDGKETEPETFAEGYISESKKLVYKTYNQAMIDLKGAAGPNPITDVIKVTSAYPIMYDLIRNLVLLSDKKQTVEIDAEGTTDVDMLNYIAYRNAIALVGLAVENMNQAIKKSTTELDNKIKEAANSSPISSEIANSVKHLNLLKEQKIVLDKEIEKIKEELNKKIVQIESNENVRRMNERFEQALRERNLQKGDK
jgi:hypothetical protein